MSTGSGARVNTDSPTLAQVEGAEAGTAAMQVGQRFGVYVIEAQLGAGGMGEVYLARQFEPVERQVALKVVQQRLLGTLAETLFQIEGQALARMRHPAVAQVYEVGTSGGQPYLAMEWVEGVRLDEWRERSRPSLSARLGMLAEIARGAHHAHSNGVIHRDLKPGNVLVVDHAGRAQPKIIDFGVAVGWTASAPQSAADAPGAYSAGTPRYASPEQREGRGVSDPRADVYSLGIMLFELVVDEDLGADVDTRLAERLGALLGASLGVAEAGTPADAALAQRLQGLPRELRWLIARAIADDRSQRYDSALALALDIERYLAQQPLEAVPNSRGYRLERFIARHRAGVLGTSMALLALIGGLAFALYGLGQARVERERAVAEAERAGIEARRAERISDFLRSVLTSVDPMTAGDLDKTLMRKVLDGAAQRAASELADDPLVLGAIEHVIGRTYRGLGDPKTAITLMRTGHKRLPAVPLQYTLELAQVHDDLGEYARSRAMLEERRAALAANPDSPPADLLRVDADLLEAAMRADQPEPVIARGRTLLVDAERLFGTDDPITLKILNTLARALAAAGHSDESLPLLRTLVDRRIRAEGPRSAMVLRDQGGLAIAYLQARQHAAARTLVTEMLPASTQVYGPEHPATIGLHSLLGSALKGGGEVEAAIEEFRLAYQGFAKKFGDGHPHTVGTGHNYALALATAGKHAEALALQQQLLPRAQAAFNPKHPLVIEIELALARAALATGNRPLAERTLLRAQANARDTFGPTHERTVEVDQALGELRK